MKPATASPRNPRLPSPATPRRPPPSPSPYTRKWKSRGGGGVLQRRADHPRRCRRPQPSKTATALSSARPATAAAEASPRGRQRGAGWRGEDVEDAVTEGREVSAAAGTGLPRHAATGVVVVVAVATAAGVETGFRACLESCFLRSRWRLSGISGIIPLNVLRRTRRATGSCSRCAVGRNELGTRDSKKRAWSRVRDVFSHDCELQKQTGP